MNKIISVNKLNLNKEGVSNFIKYRPLKVKDIKNITPNAVLCQILILLSGY